MKTMMHNVLITATKDGQRPIVDNIIFGPCVPKKGSIESYRKEMEERLGAGYSYKTEVLKEKV
jgi:hypothetical protein